MLSKPCSFRFASVRVGALVALTAGLTTLPAHADELGRVVVPAPRVEVESVAIKLEAPSTLRMDRFDQMAGFAQPEGVRTRMWWGSSAITFGGGADLATAPTGTSTVRPVLGVRADLSQHARMVYELGSSTPPWSPPIAAADGNGSAPEVRMALEFRAAGGGAQQLRNNGLFRVQLSSTSALQWRPRAGGLVMSWRSSF